jgi:hypothetical protein
MKGLTGTITVFNDTELVPAVWKKAATSTFGDGTLATESSRRTANTHKQRVRYPTGFHVYKTEATARRALDFFLRQVAAGREDWRVRPVLVRNVHTEGTDGASTSWNYRRKKPMTLVADEIMLIPGY